MPYCGFKSRLGFLLMTMPEVYFINTCTYRLSLKILQEKIIQNPIFHVTIWSCFFAFLLFLLKILPNQADCKNPADLFQVVHFCLGINFDSMFVGCLFNIQV